MWLTVWPGFLSPQPKENVSESFSQLTPMAGIAFKAPESLIGDTPIGSGLVYFTWSQGYKSGGFSTRRDPSQGATQSGAPRVAGPGPRARHGVLVHLPAERAEPRADPAVVGVATARSRRVVDVVRDDYVHVAHSDRS